MTVLLVGGAGWREQSFSLDDFLSDWFADPDFHGCRFLNALGELGSANLRVTEIVREHKADV
ncbi:hypothetical protein [Rhodococcus sp. NPDC047139]|uniref:hypothetical protein n=1 Tax=Rhodococcus sp. NPDC047139 TaxID=3155141 RepID=UPI003405AB33